MQPLPTACCQFFRILLLGLALALPVGAEAQDPPKVDPRAWTELDIVPMPKEIRLTDRDLVLDPKRVALAMGAKPCRQSVIATDWINQRIAALKGPRLNKVATDRLPARPTTLIIGTIEDNPLIARAAREKIVNVGAKNPGERGYEIRASRDGKRIYLAGADPIGALYACVTFGEMLYRRGASVAWRSAEVRDWPDTIYVTPAVSPGNLGSGGDSLIAQVRAMFGNANPTPAQRERYLAVARDEYDQLLRRKVTMLRSYGYQLHGWAFKAGAVREGLNVIRKGNAYALERGIHFLNYAEKPFVGLARRYPELKQKEGMPENARCAKWIRTWGFDDTRRFTARELALFAKALGYTDVGFHDTDTGGWDNPTQWNDRPERDRERWGDDYTAATAQIHRIYLDAIKEIAPGSRVHFALYPYQTDMLDPESCLKYLKYYRHRYPGDPKRLAPRYKERYTKRWKRLHEMFPLDVTFGYREAPAPAVEAFRTLTPGRGLFGWLGLGVHPWQPVFCEEVRGVPTFCKYPNDFIFLAYSDVYVPFQSYAAREYSWNTKTPGACPWRRFVPVPGRRPLNPKGELYELILPRIVRNIFGLELAPHITEAASLRVDVRHVHGALRNPNDSYLVDYPGWKEELQLITRGADAMDAAWAKLTADPQRLGLDGRALRRVVFLREIFHAAKWVARVRTAEMHARELAAQRDLTGAEAALKAGADALKLAAPAIEKILAERPRDPELPIVRLSDSRKLPYWRQFCPMADRVNLVQLRAQLEQTRGALKGLAARAGVPKDVLPGLRKHRIVRGARRTAPIQVDGRVNEAAWRRARPVESFLIAGHDEGIAQAHTRARVLYDDTRLYVGFTCWLPGGGPVSDNDSVEVFLDPAGARRGYRHLLINAGGALANRYVHNGVGTLASTPACRVQTWAAETGEGGTWYVEMAIPFGYHVGGPPQPGDRWVANFTRARNATEKTEYSTWCPLVQGGFNQPEKFGIIVFTDRTRR